MVCDTESVIAYDKVVFNAVGDGLGGGYNIALDDLPYPVRNSDQARRSAHSLIFLYVGAEIEGDDLTAEEVARKQLL